MENSYTKSEEKAYGEFIPRKSTYSAYLYLAKVLGFVPSQKVDVQNLKYDVLEFIRKFLHQNPEIESSGDLLALYKDIKISNFSQAPFQHGILDDLKTKLLGWIANHTPTTPKSNLTDLEQRGRKWISERIRSKSIFVTKADKGGATLILNYNDVEEAIEKEILAKKNSRR